MATRRTPRSTRDRPAKPPLSAGAIIDAALNILQADGLNAMTMRRVASALDTSAGALYVYFANREALLAAIFDHILATVPRRPPDPTRWRDQLYALLTGLRDALTRYPGIAAATMADLPRTDAALDFVENLLGILLAAGLRPRDAAWTADILAAQVTHAAIEADQRHPEHLLEQVTDSFAKLPTDRFPLITRHAPELVAGKSDERFRYAIDSAIDSALAHATHEPATAHRGAGCTVNRDL